MSDIENFLDDVPKKSKLNGFLSTVSVKTESLMRDLFVNKPYHGLFKDLEISRGQFITLFLIFFNFTSVLMIDIFLSIDFVQTPQRTPLIGITNLTPAFFMILGLISGLILGGILIDRVRGKRYPALFKLFLISMIITFSHIIFFRRFGDIVPKLMFLSNSFIAGMLFIFFLTFFIDFTTILERGRVFSYLIIVLAISLGILVYIISLLEILMFLPVIIIFLSLYYLYKNRELEEPYKPIEKESDAKNTINFDAVKYIVLIGVFGLTIGLFLPSTQVGTLTQTQLSTLQIIGIILISIIVSLLTATGMGMIFDFYGRKATLANIILVISIVNFIKLFNVKIPYFDLAVIFAALLACFMAVPLLISELTTRKNLGKILGIAFTTSLFSVAIGAVFGYIVISFMPGIFASKYTADIFLVGMINFAAIVCLFFLIYIKETMSSKEQNWPDYLIHLYVVHESGILLYEYSFIEEELIEADLISGGFVGLIALLQEITKEEQKLKSIDHGGKRILFGFDSKRTIIYALLVTEELIILRNKRRPRPQ